MNKKYTIIILVSLIIIAIVGTAIMNKTNSSTGDQGTINEKSSEAVIEDYALLVRHNGKLYKYNYERAYPSCGTADGFIEANVKENEIPQNDDESNFKGKHEYQYGLEEGTLLVRLDDEGYYVFTQVDETLARNTILTDSSTYENKEKTEERLVKINGKLYRDTGKVNNIPRCGMMDGFIVYTTQEKEIPQRNDEANFSGAVFYQGSSGKIDVKVGDNFYIFEEYNI